MINYVLGFPYFFINNEWCPLLLKGSKPGDRFGLLNGFGGKINDNESAQTAMGREFMEESNLPNDICNLINWEKIGEIQGHNFHITLFQAFSSQFINNYLPTINKEGIVDLYYLDNIQEDKCVQHAHMLLLNKDKLMDNLVYISYVPELSIKFFKKML